MRGVSVGSVVERVLANIMPDESSGCWLWTGHVKNNGYGTLAIKIGGRWKTQHAHRVAYEALVGPVPDGHDIDHLCRTRCCVNPYHLEAVSRSVNLSRSPLMNRQAAKTSCPRGHIYSGSNNRGSRICHQCAAETTARYREKQTP